MRYGVSRMAKHPELGKPLVGRRDEYVYLCLWKPGSRNGHNLFYRTTPEGIEVLAFRDTSIDNS